MNSLLHITTDKPVYLPTDDVLVTATLDQWNPQGKIRLVIWLYETQTHIADQYFNKPKNGFTVHWTVPASTFDTYIGKLFDAQLEFGTLHADIRFNH